MLPWRWAAVPAVVLGAGGITLLALGSFAHPAVDWVWPPVLVGTGSPTVVVEAGGGEMAANLGWITPTVERDTTICVYDRAGRGWSEDADSPQDALAISTDLRTLLHRAGVAGPYVMAGHSFGGLYALTFAATHPDEVAGLVLIDSTSPHYGAENGAAPVPGSYDVASRVAALTSSVARLGVGRLYSAIAVSDLPPRQLRELQASTATAATLRSTIEEYARANTSMDEAASLRDFGDKPLMVLSAGPSSRWSRRSAPGSPCRGDGTGVQAAGPRCRIGHLAATSQHTEPVNSPIAAPPTTSTGQWAPMYRRFRATSTATATPTARCGLVSQGHNAVTRPTVTLVWAEG